MLSTILSNPIAWIVIVAALAWAGKSFKDFLDWRKLNTLKKSDEALQDKIVVAEHKIQEAQKAVDAVPQQEAEKTTDEAENFWKKL